MNPFDTLLINPILNLLIAIYKVLEAIYIPGALGLSIIILTAIIRFALWPLTTSQLKSTQKMTELKPHLERIKNEHGHDKLRHQQEVNKLYKEHGVNPLAGCLPLLLQIPVFIALYQVLLKIVAFQNTNFLESINSRLYSSALHLTQIPPTDFLWFNLADKPNQWKELGVLILLIPIATGVFQFIQSKMMVAEAPKNALKKVNNKKGGDLEDSMAQMQSQMVFLMPAMIAFFAYGFPIGLSLYWNTFTIIGIIQQYLISGSGSLSKYLPEKWRK